MDERIRHLTSKGRRYPLGIDGNAEFGWRHAATVDQAGYEIELATRADFSPRALVWSSGPVRSEQTRCAGDGAALLSRTRYYWRVRLALADGTSTAWSETAWFETGLLRRDEWKADWITDGASSRGAAPRTSYFRRQLCLAAPVLKARAYVSALGWYRLFVNKQDCTGDALVPRWTPFGHYVEYQCYDITGSLVAGDNVLGIIVAEGRYRGRNGIGSAPALYGDRLAVIAQFELELADGTRMTLISDIDWEVGTGRICSSDPKFGERADLRISADTWLSPGGAVQAAKPAVSLGGRERQLIAEEIPPVRGVRRLSGHVSRTPGGVQLVDFGQNFAGIARLKLSGRSGQRVLLAYGEVLGSDGELDTTYLELSDAPSLAEWFQRDEVILAGTDEIYQPSFTIHGFRYLAVLGLEYSLADADVEAIVLSTDLAWTSRFACSDPRLNRLHQNVRWSLRSNFVDTPTDCPTRERSGWTGDIQVFGPTATILVECRYYLRRYLRNLRAEQYPDGRVPHAIPNEPIKFIPLSDYDLDQVISTSVGWGDVAAMLPWTLYQYFGDIEAVRDQYASARAWVEFLSGRAMQKSSLRRRIFGIGESEKYIVDSGFHWGEWLRPGEGVLSSIIRNLLAAPAAVATAYLARSAFLLSRMAALLEKHEDAVRYEVLAGEVAAAWRQAFVRGHGERIGTDHQDDYVRALAFELLLPEQRRFAAERLVALITEAGGHLNTGFLSTPLLLATLAGHGHVDVAYQVLMNPTMPSWLAQVERGATTIWETWEGYDEDGKAKSSHNHYAFGSVAEWLYGYVAGIRPLAPGYREILFDPHVGGALSWARASIRTPWGIASCAWRLHDDELCFSAHIPAGAVAQVLRPDGRWPLAAGKHQLRWKLPHGAISGSTRAASDDRPSP